MALGKVRRITAVSDVAAGEGLYKALVPGSTYNSTTVDMSNASAAANTTNPAIYKFTMPAGRSGTLERVNMLLMDGSIDLTKFGGIAARTNGLKIYTETAGGTTITNYTTDLTIKKSGDFVLFAGADAGTVNELGGTDDSQLIRWTFSKAGQPIRLNAGESFNIAVQDNLTSLTQFTAMVQGKYTR
jgi:hypothetical protein